MNRLFGDWMSQPYATRGVVAPGLEHFTFAELVQSFADALFDARTGLGWLALYNPGRMQSHSGINVLALGEEWEDAKRRAGELMPQRIRDMIAARRPCA